LCIAIFSDAGVGYPTKEILKRCWKGDHVNYANDDGGGFAYLTEDENWHIKKGFMTWEAFWEAFEAENFKPEHTVAIHLRLGTSGKMVPMTKERKPDNSQMCDPGCTHPFPITDDRGELFNTDVVADQIVMHNGVVGKGLHDLSDTMVAILDIIDPLIPYISDLKIQKMLAELLDAEGYDYSSRWWIAKGKTTYLLGKWIEDEETKIWYSKNQYLEPKPYEPSSIYNWGDSANSTRQPIIEEQFDLLAKDFLTKKKKVWSWVRWGKWEKGFWNSVSKATPSEATSDDHIVEVYDSNNKCIALIDSISGDTIWEIEPPKVDSEAIKHCVDCGADIRRSQSADGRCPFCYAYLWYPDGFTDVDSIECPECGEGNYIIDSTFDKGDSECCRCGCIFVSSITGKDSIVDWNMDTKHERERVIRELQEGADGQSY
jgi:hypothetical protein